MATKTQYDLILDAIMSEGKPLQRGEIKEIICNTGFRLPDIQLGVLLNRFVKNGKLGRLKYPNIPYFYTHPDWIKKGKIKRKFDPYTKKYIDEKADN